MAKEVETKITMPTDTELMIDSVFDAPRELVWQAHTDPKLVPKWWGLLDGYTTRVEKLEVKDGGEWRFVGTGPDGEWDFHGKFKEIKEPESITWTFTWEGNDGEPSVETLHFEEMDGKTRLWSVAKYATKEDRDAMTEADMESGVRAGYKYLAELLEKMKSGEF